MMAVTAFVPAAGGSLQAAPLPACPAKIETKQALASSSTGWLGERRDVGHLLDGVGFFSGPVAENAELAPSDAAGTRYDVTDTGVPVRLVCRYRGTDVMLARPVPKGARQCMVGPRNVVNCR